MVKRKKMKKQRTAVTPFVHAIASKYYDVDLDVVGQIPSYVDINLLDVKEPFRPYADLDYTPKVTLLIFRFSSLLKYSFSSVILLLSMRENGMTRRMSGESKLVT